MIHDTSGSMNIAVIGGGYAGMAAAVTLAERGLPVTVFEAAVRSGAQCACAVADSGQRYNARQEYS